MNHSKATRAQLKKHNQQLILRAVYQGIAVSRAALAQETGLAKPTVSDIVNELMDAGFIEEGGRGSSTTSGGKRPRLLNFLPDVRQVIGVSITPAEITACLAFLDSTVVAQHHVTVPEDGSEPLFMLLESAINALMTQCDVPLLSLCVGVPGVVDSVRGVVESSPPLGWEGVELAQHLQDRFSLPVYVNNNTQLATQVQTAYDTDAATRHLVTVLASDTIEIGMAFQRTVFHHGGDMMPLPLSGGTVARLTWRHIKGRAQALMAAHPASSLHHTRLTYTAIGHAARTGDAAGVALVDEIAADLTEIYRWIIGLMRPDEIALAGSMSDTGDLLMSKITDNLHASLPARALSATRLTLARSRNLSVSGAVANAIHQELGIL